MRLWLIQELKTHIYIYYPLLYICMIAHLGSVESLNQFSVVQNVAFGLKQQFQNGVLDTLSVDTTQRVYLVLQYLGSTKLAVWARYVYAVSNVCTYLEFSSGFADVDNELVPLFLQIRALQSHYVTVICTCIHVHRGKDSSVYIGGMGLAGI